MNAFNQVARELPKYRCHKEVWALKIAAIETDESPISTDDKEEAGATITPIEPEYAPFHVDMSYVRKHRPQVGGYFVVYKDGYQSFSPAQAFDEGYTKI